MANPYAAQPDYAFWRRSMAGRSAFDVDPVTAVPFVIGPTDKVATAGSCFAQHIAKIARPRLCPSGDGRPAGRRGLRCLLGALWQRLQSAPVVAAAAAGLRADRAGRRRVAPQRRPLYRSVPAAH